jgi:hypothetical protein
VPLADIVAAGDRFHKAMAGSAGPAPAQLPRPRTTASAIGDRVA